MSFVSFTFVVFFVVVTTLYFILPHRWRWSLLLLASSLFYMAYVPEYIFILLGLAAIDYVAARLIEKKTGRRRTMILWVSIGAMVGVLIFFKYFNFLSSNIAWLADLLHLGYNAQLLSIALPLGLSFHAFQSLAYVIEVYRGKQQAEKNLGLYALYVMFYPQLVAGPIERPQHLLPQFREAHVFEYERVKNGLVRMGWGAFKKIVIADRLAQFVDPIHAALGTYPDAAVVIASIFFTVQLYVDFSAYCDIALGAAAVMGFRLQENFDRPFAARSIAEFWRRWHISLSTWFRDYFYYPLLFVGQKKTVVRMYVVLFLTFVVTGFWHGANWTFGMFGALQGLYIISGALTQNIRAAMVRFTRLALMPRLQGALQIGSVFFMFMVSCIFFRAQSMTDAWNIIGRFWNGTVQFFDYSNVLAVITRAEKTPAAFWTTVVLAIGTLAIEQVARVANVPQWIAVRPMYMRWAFYWGCLFLMIILNEARESPFIYFQF